MLYLLVAPSFDYGRNYKVGMTGNLEERMRQYACHNSSAKLLETATVGNEDTRRLLEKMVHIEIQARGFEFLKADTADVTTEWFFVPMDKVQEFEQGGLSQFKSLEGCIIQKVVRLGT